MSLIEKIKSSRPYKLLRFMGKSEDEAILELLMVAINAQSLKVRVINN